jgi:hypothetical protein
VLGATRDTFIIIWGILSVVQLLLLTFAVWRIYKGVMGLIDTFKAIANDDVKPVIAIGKDTANNVAGTTRFMSDTVAKPVIKGLSVVAGTRKAVAVFTGLTGRGRKV